MELFEQLKSFDIILASKSPRRHEIMTQSGIPFRVLAKPVSEKYPSRLPPEEVALWLSRKKVQAYEEELKSDGAVVIAADTIVVLDGQIINKPQDEKYAMEMLRMLSGKSHDVITGVCIRHQKSERRFFEITRVFFRVLSEEEIRYYVNHYRPLDKAGAYGIQEWIGYVGIHHIEGSYLNVMGLPVERVFTELKTLLNL